MISKKVSAKLKENIKIFLKKIRIYIIIVIVEDHDRQAFNSLKTLYNVILTNENSNEKISNNEKKKKKKSMKLNKNQNKHTR